MSQMSLIATLLTLLSTVSFAQEDRETLKKRLLEKVRERIQAENAKTLERVARMIDEEFSTAGAKKDPPAASPIDAKIRETEKEKKKLELKIEELSNLIRRLQRFKEDEAILEELKKDPLEPDEVQAFFDAALGEHRDKNFDTSIHDFKKLFYQFSKESFGSTSAYNVACGYSLAGDKERALDWLEISIEHGFNSWDHIRKDADLESLRDHVRYKKLMADK